MTDMSEAPSMRGNRRGTIALVEQTNPQTGPLPLPTLRIGTSSNCTADPELMLEFLGACINFILKNYNIEDYTDVTRENIRRTNF